MLELEARLERRLGHLELLGARLRRRVAVLELVSRLRQCPRERMLRVPRHPAEELGCRTDRTDLRNCLRMLSVPLRREPGEDVADRRRNEERAHEMPAAALVLLGRALPVLVATDRDVLRAVVRGELARAQRHHCGRDGDERRQQLPRDRPQLRLAQHADEYRRAEHRAERARVLHRQLRGRKLGLDLRQQQKRLGEPGGAAEQRALDPRRLQALARRCDLDAPVLVPDRARPRMRAVHEHAVRESHAAEPDFLLGHRLKGSRLSPVRSGPHDAASRRRARDRQPGCARPRSG